MYVDMELQNFSNIGKIEEINTIELLRIES